MTARGPRGSRVAPALAALLIGACGGDLGGTSGGAGGARATPTGAAGARPTHGGGGATASTSSTGAGGATTSAGGAGGAASTTTSTTSATTSTSTTGAGGAGPACPDGACGSGETCASCPADCGPCTPVGKANWVVAQGRFRAGHQDTEVRLGTYTFDGATGRVHAAFHAWFQKTPAPRVGLGLVPSGDCAGGAGEAHACDILVPKGWAGPPNELRDGAFTLAAAPGGTAVHVDWDAAAFGTEDWLAAPSPDGLYATLAFVAATRATAGYGAGSNAGLDERRAMVSVLAHAGPLALESTGWNANVLVSRGPDPWTMSLYGLCSKTTWVATYFQPSSPGACKKGCVAPWLGDTSIEYYLARVDAGDRRDTLWHWCTCLAKGKECYPGNSHVKPLLEVLDDQARFRGWIGAEASFNPYAGPDPRAADMLGVLRVYEP